MHFILSDPGSSLHIFDHTHYKKKSQHNFRKWGGGRVEGHLEFFWKFVGFGSAILPLKGHRHPHILHHYSCIIFLYFKTKVAKNGLLGGMEGWSGYSIFLPRAIRAQEPNMGVARICSHMYTITKSVHYTPTTIWMKLFAKTYYKWNLIFIDAIVSAL